MRGAAVRAGREWTCELRNVSNGESVTGFAFQTSPSMIWLFSLPRCEDRRVGVERDWNVLATLLPPPHHVGDAFAAPNESVGRAAMSS